MRNAANRGTAVHTLTENYLNNEELSQQGVLPTALFTILKTELDKINNIVMQEGSLYSDPNGVLQVESIVLQSMMASYL